MSAKYNAGDAIIQKAVELSCEGDFNEAVALFKSIDTRSNHYAAALHSLGNIAAISGDLANAGTYHEQAKQHDPGSLPPLAVMHMEKMPCNNISDIFWTSSFAKKEAYELLFEGKKHTASLAYKYAVDEMSNDQINVLFDLHVGLATQLEGEGDFCAVVLLDLSFKLYNMSREQLFFSAPKILVYCSTHGIIFREQRNFGQTMLAFC